MKTNNLPEEVLVLRFFETGPIEKVEAVFNIVCEKMRERGLNRSNEDEHAAVSTTRSRRPQRQKAGSAPPADANLPSAE